jgi:hypothetical protein
VAGSYVPRLVVSDPGSASLAAQIPEDAEPQAWHDKDGRGVGCAYVVEEAHVVELDGVARFAFAPGAADVVAIPAPGASEALVEEYFRRWILPVAVQVRGLEVLHASAVVAPRGVAAFSAASEAGKSTLAFALGRRGYRIWTDDALAFDVSSAGPETFPLPFRLRLRPGSATHFGLAPEPGGTIAAQSDAGPEKPETITALFLLERAPSGPAVRLEPADPLEAFPALVEGSYHFGREEGERKRAMLSRYLTLATAIPVYRLIMATGLANLDEVLDAVEERLR